MYIEQVYVDINNVTQCRDNVLLNVDFHNLKWKQRCENNHFQKNKNNFKLNATNSKF